MQTKILVTSNIIKTKQATLDSIAEYSVRLVGRNSSTMQVGQEPDQPVSQEPTSKSSGDSNEI